eukprot:SAG22_NODE_389_length_11276_cov_12.397244_3_plen_210_part_00
MVANLVATLVESAADITVSVGGQSIVAAEIALPTVYQEPDVDCFGAWLECAADCQQFYEIQIQVKEALPEGKAHSGALAHVPLLSLSLPLADIKPAVQSNLGGGGVHLVFDPALWVWLGLRVHTQRTAGLLGWPGGLRHATTAGWAAAAAAAAATVITVTAVAIIAEQLIGGRYSCDVALDPDVIGYGHGSRYRRRRCRVGGGAGTARV